MQLSVRMTCAHILFYVYFKTFAALCIYSITVVTITWTTAEIFLSRALCRDWRGGATRPRDVEKNLTEPFKLVNIIILK